MTQKIFQSLPIIPEGITWEDWNAQLLHYFGEEPIPVVPEERWKEVAFEFSGLPTFSAYNLPDPEDTTDWKEWAQAAVVLINGPTT